MSRFSNPLKNLKAMGDLAKQAAGKKGKAGGQTQKTQAKNEQLKKDQLEKDKVKKENKQKAELKPESERNKNLKAESKQELNKSQKAELNKAQKADKKSEKKAENKAGKKAENQAGKKAEKKAPRKIELRPAEKKKKSEQALKQELEQIRKEVLNKETKKTGKKQQPKQQPEKIQQPVQETPAAHKKNNKPYVQANPGATVKIIPLGGLEQIGLNITAFESGNSIVVVDCGIAFPTDEMPGIDLLIPDVTYLKENKSKVKGFFITHGHEDHIGALPYVLKELNIPVYATRLSMGLIEHKLEEAGILESAKLHVVKHGDVIKAGDFKIEFIKTNHSIQDASALAIFSPAGTIFHTGDFKIDYTPIFGDPIDLQRMAEIGTQGCLALMCDSTNATKAGSTPSEKTVGENLDEMFVQNKDYRIIVATFASNVDRVQQIINCAHKIGRKVVIDGRSMELTIEIATKLGYISIPDGVLIDIEQLKNYRPKDTVIITTGSQGESMAALSRMAAGTHKKIRIDQGDVIIFSSSPIPGNEKAISKVINELYKKGAEVIFQGTHVSGHACQEDIKLIYSLLKPKYAIPVHGEPMHLAANKKLAVSMGMDPKSVRILESGDVLEIGQETFEVVDHVQAAAVMVDGLGVGDVGSVVLKDRQNLAQNGIIIVAITLDQASHQLIAGPELFTRGFIYVDENEDLLEEARSIVEERINKVIYSGKGDPAKIRTEVRDALKNYLWNRLQRTPGITTIVMEA